MIYPKFLYLLGAFGVDGVLVFYPLRGQVLGVQDPWVRPCCLLCLPGVQIGYCVEWLVE